MSQLKNFIFIFLVFFIYACNSKQESGSPATSTNQTPSTVELNINGGYVVNKITGDTISPLKDKYGKVIKTGIPVKTIGIAVNPDTLKPAIVIPKGKSSRVTFSNNIFPVQNELVKTPLENDDFLVVPINPVFVKNKAPGKIKVKKYKPTLPVVAAVPVMKDNAEYNVQILDVDQRLNSSYLNALIKDRKGNIWAGSWGGGATKYDGKYFTVFSEREGLSNLHVYALLEDSKGNIWFGTYGGGVSMFDGTQFYHYTEENGLAKNYIWSLAEDKNGNIWIGTDGGGVSKFNGKAFTNYSTESGLCGDIVYSIFVDAEGILWFGTAKEGVCKFDGEKFSTLNAENGMSDANVWAIYQDRKKNMWLGTGNGVVRYDGKDLISYTEESGLSNRYVYSIRQDKSGKMIFGTYGGGLSLFDGEKFETISTTNGLSNDFIKAILYDENGIIWMATDGGGLNRYTIPSFRHFTTDEGVADNYVNVISEDLQKNLLIGSYGGLSVFDNQSFENITTESGLPDQFIRDVLVDSKGNTWLGTDLAGAVKYDGKSFTAYGTEQGLSYNAVYSIIEDKKGNLWFGTYGGGVTKFNGSNFIHYTEENGLTSNNVYCLYEDRNGNIWIGTWGGGVTKFDGESFTHYTEREGLFNNHINSVFHDKDGFLWFGTNAGATIFDGKKFVHYTTREGLCNNVVYSFVQGKNGQIWVGTENGLSCLSKTKNNNYFVRTNLVKEDGLKGVDFILNSNFIDHSNRAWWGCGKALEMLDLNEYSPSEIVPQISFHHLLINESYIDFRNLPDSLNGKINFESVAPGENYPVNLELPYHFNHLTFHFTAIDWLANHKLKYQYKLEGLDNRWNPLTEHTFADYRNIPYGTYTFKVRAIGESQKWSKTFEYQFTIHPPWWHTTWFRISVVAAFSLLLFLIFRWRTAALRKRQKQLEQTVKERTAEVVHQKEIVEEKHKEITDSINYAKRLQQAILTPKEEIDRHLPDNFLLYKPKDIVAGDFYFFEVTEEFIFYAAADCTGHGVPGAMLSIVCANALSRSVKEFGLTDPGQILDKTRELILETFEKSKQDVKDGMDISFLSINRKNKRINWAGANNPLWYIEGAEMKEIKANKQPIGKSDHLALFTTHELPANAKSVFLFTDGYADQFGGPNGKKFKYSNFQKLLMELNQLPAKEMSEKLDVVFNEWKNDLEQVDDVCIIGIRI